MTLHSIYTFMTGMGFQMALGLCLVGSIARVILFLVEASRKDRPFLAFYSIRFAARSMAAHMIPFVSRTTRAHPVTTLLTTLFHIGTLVVLFFYSAHVILISDALGTRTFWPMLPERLAHIFSWMAVLTISGLTIRRLASPTLRYITLPRDHLLNLMILLVLISGIWTRLQLTGFVLAGVIHITAANLLIAMTPFSTLSHLFMIPLTRGYAGSEFGGVRHIEDW